MSSNLSPSFLFKKKKKSGNYYRKTKKFRSLWRNGVNKENIINAAAVPVYRSNATLGENIFLIYVH
jgi:hypothetical protein